MDQEVLYEPESRDSHVACSSDGHVIVWGGGTSEYFSNDAARIKRLASVVQEFDPCTEEWCQRDTIGTPHAGLTEAASTSDGSNLFLYGGDVPGSCCGSLSRLDMKTLTWSLLCPEDVAGGPMKKVSCGIVLFHGDKLAVVGGYGVPGNAPPQPGSTFIRDTRVTNAVLGHTNEFHVFDISQGVWSSPNLTGTRPPPCAIFSLTSINNSRAILFAGFQPRYGRINDMYIIDFDIMGITKLVPRTGTNEPWPVERSFHAASCLGYGDHTHLLITGGLGKDNKTLTDMWLFNPSLPSWKEISLLNELLPRWCHSATVIPLCSGLAELILFGGRTDDYVLDKLLQDYSRIAETTIITFGQLGSEWVVVGVTNNSQRGNSERVQDKRDVIRGIDFKELPFDIEKRITPYTLYRVERSGVELRKEISNKNRDFQAVLRLKQPDSNIAMIKWLNTERKTDITPTWKNLFLILCLIDLDHVAKQIEALLRGTTVEQLLTEETSSVVQVHEGKKFDTENVFTMSSLTKLERVGILVLTQLGANNHAFQTVIRVKKDDVSGAINKWLTAPVLSRIIPSWKNFLTVLCLIKLDDLAKQIKTYLLKHPKFTLELEKGEVEVDSREIFTLRQKLSDRDETIGQLRKENEANEDTIKMLKKRNQELNDILQSSEDVKSKQKEIKPYSKQVPSPMIPSPAKSQPSSGLYHSEESLIKLGEELISSPIKVKGEPTEMTTKYLSSADGSDVDTTKVESTERYPEPREIKPFAVTRTLEMKEIKQGLFQPPGLPGVEVCAETTVLVTNSPQSFIWKGYGLKLNIPQGCLPQDVPQCQIAIKASLAGQYEFPENSHLVSAVFWLCCEPKCVLAKKLTLEIDHCAKLNSVSRLSIVRARCNQKHDLPYTFKKLGGSFNQHSSYGVIDLSSFSGVAATQGDSAERDYCAMLYYLIDGYDLHIHFVVTWNTKCHRTVVKKEYIVQKEARLGHTQPISFDSNTIQLDVPVEGVKCTCCKRWIISALFPPVVEKSSVDNFEEGKMIPSCQLTADLLEKKASLLKHCVHLVGAKKPYDQFLIKPPADIITIVANSGKKDDQNRQQHISNDLLRSSERFSTDTAGPSPINELTGSKIQDSRNIGVRKRRRQTTPADPPSSPESAAEYASEPPSKIKHTTSEIKSTHIGEQSTDLSKVQSPVGNPLALKWKNIKDVQRNQPEAGAYHLQFKFDHGNEKNIEVSVTKCAERLTFKIVKCDYLGVSCESEYCSDFTVDNKAHESIFEDIVKGNQLSEPQLSFLADNITFLVEKKIHYTSHPPQYGIFLSHQSNDRPIINAVKKGLKFMGYATWIYKENIGVGEYNMSAIRSGIDRCSVFVAWMNKDFFGNDLCKGELKYALKSGKIIFTFGNQQDLTKLFTGEFSELNNRNIVDPTQKSLFEILRLIDDALHK